MITLEYHGVEASGRTVKEAKEAAGVKIRAALSGSYTPSILVHRGYVSLVYREPGGWCHRIIGQPGIGIGECRVYAYPNDQAEKDATRAAQRHLAQLGWVPDDGLTVPEFLTDREDVSEFRRHAVFQLRYQWARKHGLDDGDAHEFACGCLGRPDLVNRIPPYPGPG